MVTDPPRQAVISGPELAGPITVQASQRPTSAHARTITLVILGLRPLAVSGSVTLSTWQARRLAEPLAALAIRATPSDTASSARGGFRGVVRRPGAIPVRDVADRHCIHSELGWSRFRTPRGQRMR